MKDFVVVDIETTGLSVLDNKIIEIGGVKVIDLEVVEEFSMLINPEIQIPQFITELTGITDSQVRDKEKIEVVLPKFIEFAKDFPLLGHNLSFDYGFLKENANRQKLKFDKNGVDTLRLANRFIKEPTSKSLTNLIKYFEINRLNAHRAYDDAYATFEIYKILYEKYALGDNTAFDPIFLTYKKSKTTPISAKQIKFLGDLIRKNQIVFDREIESLTMSEASKEIDRIIRTYGKS